MLGLEPDSKIANTAIVKPMSIDTALTIVSAVPLSRANLSSDNGKQYVRPIVRIRGKASLL